MPEGRQAQYEVVLRHLEREGPLTPLVALDLYGIARLAARVDDLKRQGYSIRTTMVHRKGKRWAEYSLVRNRTLVEVFESDGEERVLEEVQETLW